MKKLFCYMLALVFTTSFANASIIDGANSNPNLYAHTHKIKLEPASSIITLEWQFAPHKNKIAGVHWLPDFQGAFNSRTNEMKGGDQDSACSAYDSTWASTQPDTNKYDFTTKTNVDGQGLKCYANVKCKARFQDSIAHCPNGQTIDEICEINGVKKYTFKDCADKASMISSGWSLNIACGYPARLRSNHTSCATYYHCCANGFSATDYPSRTLTPNKNQKIESQAGIPSCQKLVAKTCSDYDANYQPTNDTTKNCSKVVPDNSDGLICYKCGNCDASYSYNSSNCSSPRILGTTTCGDKSNSCTCPTGVNNCTYGCKKYAAPCDSICQECNSCTPNTLTSWSTTAPTNCTQGMESAADNCGTIKYSCKSCESVNKINLETCWTGGILKCLIPAN